MPCTVHVDALCGNIYEVTRLHNDRSAAQYCDVLRSTAQLRRRFCCSNGSLFDFCCSMLRGTSLLRVLCECCCWFACVRLQRLDAVKRNTAQYCDALRSTAPYCTQRECPLSPIDSQSENKLRQRWVKYKFPDRPISQMNNSLAWFPF